MIPILPVLSLLGMGDWLSWLKPKYSLCISPQKDFPLMDSIAVLYDGYVNVASTFAFRCMRHYGGFLRNCRSRALPRVKPQTQIPD